MSFPVSFLSHKWIYYPEYLPHRAVVRNEQVNVSKALRLPVSNDLLQCHWPFYQVSNFQQGETKPSLSLFRFAGGVFLLKPFPLFKIPHNPYGSRSHLPSVPLLYSHTDSSLPNLSSDHKQADTGVH